MKIMHIITNSRTPLIPEGRKIGYGKFTYEFRFRLLRHKTLHDIYLYVIVVFTNVIKPEIIY